jgi:hypothetical protein
MSRIIILILMHAVGDFFLQGKKLSRLKALKLPYLLEHAGIYTLLFIVLSPLVLGLTIIQGVIFSMANGILHLIIDYFTGKFKTKYFEVDESKYITAIGLDHTIHIVLLIGSYMYFFPNLINSGIV